MKKLICFGIITLATLCDPAQTGTTNYEWHFMLKVVDEDGNPVAGAKAGVGYYTHSQPAALDGVTDTNGIFLAKHSVGPSSGGYALGFGADKPGYYSVNESQTLPPTYDPAKWNQTITLTLRKVGKPIAMYAKRVNENPPILGQPVGYDLMAGDWVSVGHKGINSDIVFQKEAYRKSGADYEYKVNVTFPKSGDGIQIYTVPDSEKGSGFRSPHEAPFDGYQSTLSKERSAHPGQPAKNDDDPNRIYLFRVRTALDHQGNVVSAYYGKIYGDFMQFTYYLNPTPNDRNVEFNPKQNLLGDLQSFEKVAAP